MDLIKRRFYFDNTGQIFFETNVYGESTVEQEIIDFKPLSDRNRDTFDVLEIPGGEYEQDFAECNGYRVDVSGAEPTLVFSYPDPNVPGAPPVYQAPLTTQVAELKSQNADIIFALVSNNLM